MTENFHAAISRRQFGRMAAALGAGAALLPFVGGVARAEPKSGGRLRIGASGTNASESWDPATWGVSVIMGLGGFGCIYNNLVEIGSDGVLKPELAESYEAAPDAKTWTFKLRSGVTFSNGKTLTADDVVASINHHRGPDSKSSAKPIVDGIANIKSDGSNTVVIELSSGNADFAYLLSDYHLVVGPADNGKVDWSAHIGTGGYTLAEYDVGNRLLLKRRDGYWKPNAAWFDEVEIIGIDDVAARMNAVLTGEVDVISNADIATVGRLKARSDVVVDEVTGTQQFTMPMFTDTAPFNNVDVRLALKYAIDRDEMVQKILNGHGKVANDQPIAPANRYFNADLPARAYDPDKAKFHLKKTGAGGLKVDLHAADAAFQGALDTAVLFSEQASKAGINVNVVREPNDGYWSNVWTKKPFVMCFWQGRPTEDWMFSQVYAADAPWNDTHWKNPKFNKLLLEARSELDDAKRKQMYGEMQRLVSDDGGVIIPMFANYVLVRRAEVAHGPSLSSVSELDGMKCGERWWFA
ncbi:ABC transporter substrate-binding protein [Mesorhizobium sp. M1006]|uniref:ABC transporter substrate-binding protein n=1 Tax=Mesorhizobium sp. M1006 TaxID=2957048 RepID=UPI00333A6067